MIAAIVLERSSASTGLIGLTLLVAGSGILRRRRTLAEHPMPGAGIARRDSFPRGRLARDSVTGCHGGPVCGGALFAAERDSRDIGFSNPLPVSRWQLWRAKITAGNSAVVAKWGLVLAVAEGLAS